MFDLEVFARRARLDLSQRIIKCASGRHYNLNWSTHLQHAAYTASPIDQRYWVHIRERARYVALMLVIAGGFKKRWAQWSGGRPASEASHLAAICRPFRYTDHKWSPLRVTLASREKTWKITLRRVKLSIMYPTYINLPLSLWARMSCNETRRN